MGRVAENPDFALTAAKSVGKKLEVVANWHASLKQSLAQPAQETFQQHVEPWLLACFGEQIAADTVERNHRFFEEAAELVQACGMPKHEAHQLVEYVYGRPVGEPNQEAGGVMVTLAALCR